MIERKSRGIMVRTGRWIIALATLSALVLALAVSSRAQSQSAGSKSAPASTAKSAAKPAAPKGQSEGITVHGHWTIDVKNPDGKVVTHREFENALTSDGKYNLALLLARYSSVGYWGIYLTLSGTAVANGGSSPCSASIRLGGGSPSNICFITEPQISLAAVPFLTGCSSSNSCSNNLSVPPYSSVNQSLTLTGSVVALQSGTIDTVGTTLATCTYQANGVVVTSPVTDATCSGSATAGSGVNDFSQTTLPNASGQQPVQVTVPGQTIQATVQFTFN